jgi:hypothetical protein
VCARKRRLRWCGETATCLRQLEQAEGRIRGKRLARRGNQPHPRGRSRWPSRRDALRLALREYARDEGDDPLGDLARVHSADRGDEKSLFEVETRRRRRGQVGKAGLAAPDGRQKVVRQLDRGARIAPVAWMSDPLLLARSREVDDGRIE